MLLGSVQVNLKHIQKPQEFGKNLVRCNGVGFRAKYGFLTGESVRFGVRDAVGAGRRFVVPSVLPY